MNKEKSFSYMKEYVQTNIQINTISIMYNTAL